MALVFYISGHGFGHASRDVEIINALHAAQPRTVVIRSAVSPNLLSRTLRAPYTLLPGVCDTGIVQATSVTHDDEATVTAALEFYRYFDEHIEQEVDALGGFEVSAIVGDIPPLAFEVAARLEVPSIAVGNFTWDWIYETHPGFRERAPHVIDLIRAAYRKADLALELPFSGGFDIFERVERMPLVARRPTHDRIATRRHFGLPADRRAVLLSFGGYGLPSLDLRTLDCPEWTVVTTDRIRTNGASAPGHVVMLDEGAFLGEAFRYEDLVAAVDVVLTKPGYGIIAECIAANTAMLYTSRGSFREYDLLVREMPRLLRCRFIGQDDLFAGRWRDALDLLCLQPPAPDHVPTDGADAAAGRIIRAAGD